MFSLAQRHHIVTLVDRAMQEDGIYLIHAAENLQVSAHSVCSWRAAFQDTTNPPGPYVVKNHKGPAGYLDDIQEEPIDFVTDWRVCGMPVTRFTLLVCKIGQLKPEFLEKTSNARLMCVLRFLVANDLVHRVATHMAQCPPDEVHKDAKSHLAVAVPKCVGPTRDPRFILNMDQTNSKFGNSPSHTSNERGARTIHMRTGTDDSKRCTVALTVSASGKMLTPMVIYKGTRHGCIATRKLHDHPQEMKYAMQPKAWFDETTMLDWFNEVLKPYVATTPAGIIPILFLDSFKVHLFGSIADAIQGLGVELKIIPPGCTGLVQPINVGINKPFKAKMRKIYTEWLLEQDVDAAIPSASRLDVSAFILEAVKSIKQETIVNSWCKTGFSCFE
jgi:hypothetical protein